MLLAALGWACGILYWHFRLSSALRTFERTSAPGGTPADDEENLKALETLTAAGCRSLPYVVQALDPSTPTQLLQSFTPLIGRWSDSPEIESITSVDSGPERRRKCDQIREWWRRHGSDEHQVWRFWSATCGRD
ncbi:MAG TPA: hypothetical protein VKW04_02850 [Planctomycetota bacterium]|nr:hypothetical protein [Planctomycetota bacterium]